MRSNLNFNHLECFFSVAKTLSFSKTSQELQIAQSAVSKQIKALEEHFSQQLLLRTKQKVQLTSFGKELLDKIQPLYSEILSRTDDILNEAQVLHGDLKFGCLNEVGERVFIAPLAEFKTKFPKLKIEVSFLKSFEIIEGVKLGKIDMGIVGHEVIQENIRCYKIFEEEIVMVTRSGNKNLPSKVADIPFLAYRGQDPLLEFYLKKVFPRTKMTNVHIEFAVNSHKAMLEVLNQHPYYAVLPRLSVQSEIDEGKLKIVGPKSLESNLYLIHLDLEFEDKKVRILRNHLREFIHARY
jgi:DNA-binding transcriptional LysR family regulator